MNLKRCVNGHFYNADVYASCPKCGAPGSNSAAAAKERPAEKKPMAEKPAQEKPARQKDGPVVGWAVCVEGILKGRIYELKSGENRIGGSREMDIDLSADPEVSRHCQLAIVYTPERRTFAARAGDSRDLSYVNGQMVLFDMELKNRDVLWVGGTKLMFIPLCGMDFAW